MKVYQIKIEVKNVTPPVWRRCMIPSGITFAQLSVILNAITGWNMECYYEFEFYHRKQQLRENHDDTLFRPNWQYDLLEASETYIDEFMEQEEWFSYLMRDDYRYRITIEKTLESDAAFPCVLKYKGECLQMDRVDSLEEVNEELKRKFFITYGEMQFLQQSGLYEKLAHGGYGLCGSNNPVNDEKKIYKSGNSMLESMARVLTDKFMDAARKYTDQEGNVTISDELKREFEDIFSGCADDMQDAVYEQMLHKRRTEEKPRRRGILVKDALSCYPKTDLLDYAKELEIRRVSGLKKEELAEKIANEILSLSVMKKRMSTLSDEQIQLFEKLLDCKELYDPSETEDKKLQMLYHWDYVVTDDRDLIEVPADVAEVYRKISTPEFHENRRKTVWMKKCLNVFVTLYAVAPVQILCRLYRKHTGFKADREEVLRIFDMLPEEENPCALIGNRIVYKEVLKDELYLKIEQRQGKKDFYIPSAEEIEDYSENGYFSKEQSYRKLGTFLREVLEVGSETADFMLYDIFQKISFGESPQDILDDLQEDGMVFPNDEAFFDFYQLMAEVNNNTRMFANRGFKPQELRSRMTPGEMPVIVPGSTEAAKVLKSSEAQLKQMGIQVDFDSNAREIPAAVLSNGTVQTGTRKIYPNDPCPCGSGKKYKKCCGR